MPSAPAMGWLLAGWWLNVLSALLPQDLCTASSLCVPYLSPSSPFGRLYVTTRSGVAQEASLILGGTNSLPPPLEAVCRLSHCPPFMVLS